MLPLKLTSGSYSLTTGIVTVYACAFDGSLTTGLSEDEGPLTGGIPAIAPCEIPSGMADDLLLKAMLGSYKLPPCTLVRRLSDCVNEPNGLDFRL